ncbi:unnamed protein product (macronuclear) [Paramecium tetraurelia]|uniref:Chromosome undetermined scaffold_1, whole genome shotgun sequence n=1 Tax=Paramecium tetraurelia TaxID=5888 RepID=Q6BG46_PARTE|nr:hypothetical protein [Paramecium tetraurelia strain d4-2]XP_001423309.1 uncharacterized protein GSPATT00000346001 [Paramecium tetraurelia]CAH03374.1 hypothetical protein PTMB.177 [Paramecium tetraurelia]CAK55911.1 unnamed protein product [Paramecium tetraurelia]|eukprot:XP_001423309.1 hypothetical protein (macronuclear) [Paramecium tetraurelia strain d4-2]
MQKSQLKYAKTPQYLRRSSLNSQNSSSPKKIANQTQDQMTGSQLQLEMSKSQQQSFHSSSSPVGHCQSVSSKTFQHPPSPTRTLQKRPSQIISKQQLQSMHERSIIKMLGLNLEAICTKSSHEKNKMVFICQYPNCEADNRLGCSYCQIEQHGNHASQNMEIQTFCKIFDDRRHQFDNLCNQIMRVPDKITQVRTFFAKLRITVQERLQQIEENVIKSIDEALSWQPLERDLQNRVNYLSNKNIFDMTQEELKESLSFIQGKHLSEVEYIIDETEKYLTTKVDQVQQSWNDFREQLQFELSTALGDNNKIQIIDSKQRKEYAQQKLQILAQKQEKYLEQFRPFQIIMNEVQEEEKKVEVQKQEEVKRQSQIQKQQLIQKKKEQQQRELEQIKVKEEQKKNEKQFEREKQLRTFPHILYTQDCPHRLPCNTIPIFSCCNKAYPCTQCHGYQFHPPRISNPSYRYCMNCLEIYLVLFPTNQSVNCLKCQIKQS